MFTAAVYPMNIAAPQRLIPDQDAMSPTAKWWAELGLEGSKLRLWIVSGIIQDMNEG